MSVISSYRTSIKLSSERYTGGEIDPTWRLMREAVETAAAELHGQVTDYVLDAYGHRVGCQFALLTKDFPRGVGVRVDGEGNVTFVYDHYDPEGRGLRRVAADISARIAQNYTALAVARALAEMNYAVEIDEAEEGAGHARAVVVRGSL